MLELHLSAQLSGHERADVRARRQALGVAFLVFRAEAVAVDQREWRGGVRGEEGLVAGVEAGEGGEEVGGC